LILSGCTKQELANGYTTSLPWQVLSLVEGAWAIPAALHVYQGSFQNLAKTSL